MSYEKELAELRKNWKKSTDKYEEAIEYGFVVDAAIRSHDVMEIERQIYVYEQATKADEYEAKAKAWDIMKKDFEGIADTPIGQQMLFNMSVIMERVENGDYND